MHTHEWLKEQSEVLGHLSDELQVRRSKGSYRLTDFIIQRTLGTGSFGRVHLGEPVSSLRKSSCARHARLSPSLVLLSILCLPYQVQQGIVINILTACLHCHKYMA